MLTGGPEMNLTVIDSPDRRRFEAWSDGKLAGFADYQRGDDLIVFTHTEVDPAFEGLGVGSALARAALDDARAHGTAVRAVCPFIVGWLARHPAYNDLTEAAGRRGRG